MNNGATARTGGKEAGGFALGLLTGAVVVGIVAFMYAPRSGRETRDMWKDEIAKTQQMFQGWMNDLNERIDKFSELVKFSAKTEANTVKDYERTSG